MSDRLTPSSPPVSDPVRRARISSVGRAVLVQALLVVAGLVLAGVVAGVVWWWLWSPPRGTVVRGGWYPDETGLRGQFGGTGWYVVVALVAGLMAGPVAAYLCDRAELVTLAAVVVGSVLAAWLMREVGQHLGPADPTQLARTTSRTSLPGDLRESGLAPLVSLPFASLLGLAAVYLLTGGRAVPQGPATDDDNAGVGDGIRG